MSSQKMSQVLCVVAVVTDYFTCELPQTLAVFDLVMGNTFPLGQSCRVFSCSSNVSKWSNLPEREREREREGGGGESIRSLCLMSHFVLYGCTNLSYCAKLPDKGEFPCFQPVPASPDNYGRSGEQVCLFAASGKGLKLQEQSKEQN